MKRGAVFARSLATALSGLLTLAGCGGGDPTSSEPLHVFGRTGLGPGEFAYPRAALCTPDDRLFIVDKAARVHCLGLDGTPLNEWRMPEFSAGKPTGIGRAPDGRLFLADTHYSRVVIYDPNGKELGRIGSWGRGPGQFLMPTDVAVCDDLSFYVSEYGGNDRISKFGPDGAYQFSFGGPGSGDAQLSRPQTLVIDTDGTLWVADACHHRIARFGARGEWLGSFGGLGHGIGELRFPYGLALLSDGTLVVCEYGNNRVQRFERDGRSLGVWGGAGRERGQLAYPWAVAVDRQDRVYVVDSGNNRVQVIAGRSAATWRISLSR